VTAIEQLDHRQLLSVNFTGNVPIDFPATQVPGVVILPDNPSVVHPVIAPAIAPIVKVSGFDIQDIRVSYTPQTDSLSIGLDQPLSQQPGQPGQVIAGDADNNGNDGTVNPAVTAIFPSFEDFPDFGGSEFMGAFLDLTGSGYADVVAGYSPTDPRSPKLYQVANAVVNTSVPPTTPGFGTELPQFEGNVYKVNSPQHPNFEFAINHFSQLYQQMTGQALTPNTTIHVGGFGGSANDTGIGEAFFPEQPVTISAATVPTPTPTPTPQFPVIFINPHEHRIIDTRHRDLIRVTVEGTSGFQVKQINPSTVTLDGVHAIAQVTRKVRRNEFPFATYVFPADQLNLPRGLNNVSLSGSLKDGTPFQSSRAALNIQDSARASGPLHRYLGGGSIYRSLAKLEAKHPTVVIPSSGSSTKSASAKRTGHRPGQLRVNYAPVVVSSAKRAQHTAPRPVVSLNRGEATPATHSNIPTRLRHSMADYLGHATPASQAGAKLASSAV
jgi:hypothetical protein